jgi:hypothetical protein
MGFSGANGHDRVAAEEDATGFSQCRHRLSQFTSLKQPALTCISSQSSSYLFEYHCTNTYAIVLFLAAVNQCNNSH